MIKSFSAGIKSSDLVAVILNKRSASVGLRPISLETSKPSASGMSPILSLSTLAISVAEAFLSFGGKRLKYALTVVSLAFIYVFSIALSLFS